VFKGETGEQQHCGVQKWVKSDRENSVGFASELQAFEAVCDGRS